MARSRGDIGYARVMMPLGAPCATELLRNYLWPSSKPSIPVCISRSGSRNGTNEPNCDDSGNIGTHRELYEASCLDLLPDDPSCRNMHLLDPYFQCEGSRSSAGSSNKKPAYDLNHSYAIVTAELFEEYTGVQFHNITPVESNGNGRVDSTKQTSTCREGFYFIQFQNADNIELNDMLQSDLLASDGRSSSSHRGGLSAHSDQDLMLHVLAARKEGVLGGGKSTAASRNSAAAGDLSILSTVCRWRSCLAESCKESSSKYLCRHHFNMKHFLDNASKLKDKNGSKESSKFLPKKGSITISPDNGDRDLQVIRGSSTLMQELWDGKLKATVNSFTHKTCVDLEVRRRLEMAMKYRSRVAQGGGGSAPARLQLPPRPRWSRWRSNGEIDRYGFVGNCRCRYG